MKNRSNIFIFAALISAPLWFLQVPEYDKFYCVVAPCVSPTVTLIEKFLGILIGVF